MPPSLSILSLSLWQFGLWSLDSSTARPRLPNTARQSPALAMCKVLSWYTHKLRVHQNSNHRDEDKPSKNKSSQSCGAWGLINRNGIGDCMISFHECTLNGLTNIIREVCVLNYEPEKVLSHKWCSICATMAIKYLLNIYYFTIIYKVDKTMPWSQTHPIESPRGRKTSNTSKMINKIINTYMLIFHVCFRADLRTASWSKHR